MASVGPLLVGEGAQCCRRGAPGERRRDPPLWRCGRVISACARLHVMWACWRTLTEECTLTRQWPGRARVWPGFAVGQRVRERE